MSNMKTATVREVQHGLAGLLSEVQKGQAFAVTKHGKVIARIIPASGTQAALRWPDSAGRMKRLMSAPPQGATPSEVVRELRGERL
jgi:antitoxin (DNA-binding transcriptional repressor) of toxin-antitoxin stability system